MQNIDEQSLILNVPITTGTLAQQAQRVNTATFTQRNAKDTATFTQRNAVNTGTLAQQAQRIDVDTFVLPVVVMDTLLFEDMTIIQFEDGSPILTEEN